ncbi:S-layer homology domain-containing protein [Pseudoflavonifractor phocaeensis]|uniref:S-layer homology domain-containing protein n=1 Tax=Pseudoflavonifractor phocaeensis TaxID=1870988 RepID=UPI00313C5DEE
MMKLKRLGALATTLALTLSMTALPAAAIEFTDVPSTYWGYSDISKMSNQGYAKGYEDGTFKPEGKMTAAETLLFCARATGVESSTQTKIAQARAEQMEEILPESMVSWAAKEMAVAVEAGVLTVPELEALSEAGALAKTITRENICMYLVRAMQLEPLAKSLTTYSLTYKDKSDISAALQPYVYVLTNFGIVKGTDTGDFDPKGAVTRAQMTTMLSRALDFMKTSGIVTELPEYTTYDWQGGTIAAVTSSADGAIILTLSSDISGNRSYSLPSTVKIYEDNMLTTSTALKTGQYVRLNLTSGGAVREARLSGALTTYNGSVSSLADGQLSLLVNGAARNLTIDRFTEVMVGKTVGDRSIIDEDAGYTSAVCYVDEMGHLAGVKFAGGTQLVSGLVESVTTVGGTTTLGVTQFNGVVYRYSVPTGIAVTVNGVLGSLTTGNVGDYVQVRVSNDTAEAASIAVDTVSNYIQGPIKRLGTVGTARSVYIVDQFTGKEVSYNVSQSAVITYNGDVKTVSQIESGWYVTVLVSGNMITQMEAYSGSVTVEGTLTSITYGTTTVIQITQADDSVVTYSLDITDLPTINRSNKTSSIDQLRTGDSVVVTIRYNEVEKIDATPQTANLNGTINKITMETNGVTMEVKLTDGTTATYSVSEGVSVTQGSASSNIYSLKPGYTVGLVTNGDQVISIEITATSSSATELKGTVLLTNSSGGTRTMTVQVTDSLGNTNLVTVDVKNASLMSLSGSSLSLSSGFTAGDVITAYGSYDGAAFVATIVIKQN